MIIKKREREINRKSFSLSKQALSNALTKIQHHAVIRTNLRRESNIFPDLNILKLGVILCIENYNKLQSFSLLLSLPPFL